ncbi:hypothetical protein ND748_29915, partial [Frankia sp. AiPs1]|nr:hypothetical protein [Frankia sp. AiPs1]
MHSREPARAEQGAADHIAGMMHAAVGPAEPDEHRHGDRDDHRRDQHDPDPPRPSRHRPPPACAPTGSAPTDPTPTDSALADVLADPDTAPTDAGDPALADADTALAGTDT